jgi:adenosylmethionine-8-amino-7-oxononanoate aminotransferase
MAKKARRKKQTVLTQAQLEGTKKQNIVEQDKISIAVQAVEPKHKETLDFATEYHYVITDLRRIGILAAVMMAALIALNLILK